MAVREFDGIDDILNTDVGASSGYTFGTSAAIFKFDSGGYQAFLHAHTSAGSFVGSALMINQSGDVIAMYSGGFSNGPALSGGVWYLAVARKATGSVSPRFSVYNFSTDTWTHADGQARGDFTAPGAGGTWRFNFQNSDDWFDGRVAVRAVWANEVHWSADTTGDAAIEAAGLETAASNWLNESPDAMWRFNQAAVTTTVEDDTGGGADETSRTGTAVVTGDDPPGFDFSLTSGTPYGRVTETETARALTASKAAAFGRAVETTLARAFDLIRAYATGRAAETETARAFTAAKSAAVGRVTETETARAFGVDLGAAIGRVTETETARSFTAAKAVDFSRVAEVEAARAFGVTFGHAYGRVTETEQIRGFTAAKTVAFGRVTETETVRAYAGPVTADLNPVKLSFREPSRHLTHAEATHVVGRESRHVTYQEG